MMMSVEGGQVYFGFTHTPDPTSTCAAAPQLHAISMVPPHPHCLLNTNLYQSYTEPLELKPFAGNSFVLSNTIFYIRIDGPRTFSSKFKRLFHKAILL